MSALVPIPENFSAPDAGDVDILFIAGEHSGDEHAARVIDALRRQRPELKIAALGGPEMQRAGAQLLFDMTGFSVVGLMEVLIHYSFFKKLFERTFDWVRRYRPRLICFVDYPGFNLRFAEKLRREGLSEKGGGNIALYYYISPQIWAWKSGRRFKMAKTLDSLGVIFPFEIDCYKDTDLPVRFVGHPFTDAAHASPVRYAPDAPVLLLPGSRPQAVRRIFPILLRAWKIFREKNPGRRALVLHPGEPVLSVLREQLDAMPECAAGVELTARGGDAKTVSAALMSSGTMSLSVALAGIPGAIVYRANALTWIIGRQLVKGVEYLGISNILLKRPAWPEYLQNEADPEKLAARLEACVNDSEVIYAAQEDAATLHAMLGGSAGGSCTPADWIAEGLMR